ncbi:BbrUII/HgiDII family restriction enzyme [Qipengyuania spongiae]|uniref:ATP-binding protein n=1 Tax=Qipengyuania spongiae TaxID=2909673 RepID=A0ABY5T0A8_9SPHN|nr:ATP-binding protein [Qipengyuania spongiae]UVI40015.1 ATP-binding protein [Qipengyuania spongiae]
MSFQLTISLNTLEHLGINLYSNMAAVLSEIVANAYDADATRVRIEWDQSNDRIVIEDDGSGMTEREVNDRFLTVGYRRRAGQPGLTPKFERKPMGRKGIGKLSLFSIADTVIVETRKDGESSAFRMNLPDIRHKIEDEQAEDTTYEPEPVSTDDIDFEHGTRITLTNLRRKQTVATPRALRRRVARRFQVIGSDQFKVFIDDVEVTVSDRDYYDKLQYLWTYGEQDDAVSLATNVEEHEERDPKIAPGGVALRGWIGTVKESGQLKDDEEGDNLNRIAIFVRGKMAQEDVLDAFTERGVYASYLIGEVYVDGLDQWTGDDDRDDDAATSSRQSLVEGDPRFVELKEFLAEELKHIQSVWQNWRVESGARKAQEIPEVAAWIAALQPKTRARAKKWIGKLNRISPGNVEEKSLIKQAVLAFEFHRLNENLETLESVEDEGVPTLLELFGEVDGLEASLYGQIVRSRIQVIRTLEEKVDQNALEKVIQEYLFDHLWLIDPAWERADNTEFMERRVDKLFDEIDATLTDEQKAARIDIGYRKTAGRHVIIEMKRPNVGTHTDDLSKQIRKYRTGLKQILKDTDRENEPIEILVLLGKPPSDWSDIGGQEQSEEQLWTQKARVLFYDKLMDQAHRIYEEWLKGRAQVDKLQTLMSAIDDFAPEEDS